MGQPQPQLKTSVIQPINPDVARALAQIKGRASGYAQYQDYYDGKHKLAFATEKFLNAFGSLFQKMADNICPAPIDAVADRLELTGFSVEDGSDRATAGDDAWKLWEANRMDRRAGEVHQEALKLGDGYVIVWPDAQGVPRIVPQAVHQMACRYDPEQPGVIMWAAKCWTEDDGLTRLTLYYPDRIEKYITQSVDKSALQEPTGTGYAQTSSTALESAKKFVRREVPGEAWPLVNEYDTVPVFHFANNGGVGKFGVSELKNVIPLQDGLNKAMCDMLVAMEFTAYAQRWATGVEVEMDEVTGEPKQAFKPGTDRLWAVGNELAKFGEFSVADLQNFLGVQDAFRLEIARITGTPLHYMQLLAGNPPSGEALKTLEARFVKKCLDRQTGFGNVWEDAMQLALRMNGGADVRLQADWVDPAPRSELEVSDVMLNWKTLGIADEIIWEEMGFSESQIKEMLAQKAANTPPMLPGGVPGAAPGPGQTSSVGMMRPLSSNGGGLPYAEVQPQNVRIAAPKVGG